MKYRHLLFIISACACVACSESDKPTYLAPHIITLAASDITRTGATLNGTATVEGETELPHLSFRYGTTEEVVNLSDAITMAEDNAYMRLSNLRAGTTYYYMLQGYNGRTYTYGNTLSFTTLPNEKPALGITSILSRGPLSAIVGYEITDNGGEYMTSTGCYVYTENGNKTKYEAENFDGNEGNIKLRVGNLQRNTTYYIAAYATNRFGETVGDTISYHTTDAVMISDAGELPTLIGNDIYDYTSLTLAGPLNGDDLRTLREMAGRDQNDNATSGRLTELDMSEAQIVSGGSTYGASRYTEDNVVGQGLFAHCTILSHVVLPTGATKIEKDAFEGCTGIRDIEISANVTELVPSGGCTALEAIHASEANNNYTSIDGVLLNGNSTEIVWFPMGKKGEYTLPSTITSIGDYAFRECSITKFVFPDNMTDIGQGAFMDSKVEDITMPANLKMLKTGMLQGCSHLKIVRLGAKTELISDYVFDSCPLTDIYINATYPPVCNANAFASKGSDFTQTCTLHVPKGKKQMYRANKSWKVFTHIVED